MDYVCVQNHCRCGQKCDLIFIQYCFTEKGEFNRKVCVHCKATFHSGVSLSNHLRAYAKRKRTALLEGTSKSLPVIINGICSQSNINTSHCLQPHYCKVNTMISSMSLPHTNPLHICLQPHYCTVNTMFSSMSLPHTDPLLRYTHGHQSIPNLPEPIVLACPVLNVSAYDCKQRRQRSRPGSKKKMSPTMPHAPEEMYRLTCRYSDHIPHCMPLV